MAIDSVTQLQIQIYFSKKYLYIYFIVRQEMHVSCPMEEFIPHWTRRMRSEAHRKNSGEPRSP